MVRLPTSRAMRADLDDLLLDLGHLELEQRLDEQRIAAREDEPRALGRFLQPLEHRADGVALVEMLAVVLLPVGNDRLGLAELVQHDDELAALDLLDLAREQLADLVGELVADAGPLAFAHPLDDPLLGGLHGEPTELLEGHLFLEHVADLEVGILVAGFLQRDLRARIFDRFDHLAEPDDPDGALQLVDVRARTSRSARTSAPAPPECRRAAAPADPNAPAAWSSSARGTRPTFPENSSCRLLPSLLMFAALLRTSHGPFVHQVRVPNVAPARRCCSAPSGSRSTTCSSSGTATISTVGCPASTRGADARRAARRKRRQCSGQRNGRSRPGDETSST